MASVIADIEALLRKFSAEAGLHPAVVVAIGVVIVTILFLSLFPRRPRLAPPPSSAGPPPKPKQLGDITLEELAQYNGSDPKKPLCVAIRGTVYDVSRAKHLYGPDGGYCGFAGKDASRALAKMSMDPADATGDLLGLTASELDSLDQWEAQYQFKYDVVGRVVSPAGGRPAGGPADES